MGVYIKNMEMPTSCWDCPCINGENGYCQLRKEYVYVDIPRSCPLVPVPPHGDLIDINALKLAIVNVDYVNKHDYLKGVLNAINNAPIVIPADKDGET